jgi:Luciferase-like monooxygenase
MTDAPEKPRFRLGFLTHVQGRGTDLAAAYRNAQELFVVADELGFDVGWVAQHHAPLGGGGLPSPWTFPAHPVPRGSGCPGSCSRPRTSRPRWAGSRHAIRRATAS